jgi:hypothetical protein
MRQSASRSGSPASCDRDGPLGCCLKFVQNCIAICCQGGRHACIPSQQHRKSRLLVVPLGQLRGDCCQETKQSLGLLVWPSRKVNLRCRFCRGIPVIGDTFVSIGAMRWLQAAAEKGKVLRVAHDYRSLDDVGLGLSWGTVWGTMAPASTKEDSKFSGESMDVLNGNRSRQ